MIGPLAAIMAEVAAAHERSDIRAAQRERNLARFGTPDFPGGRGEWACFTGARSHDSRTQESPAVHGRRGYEPVAGWLDEMQALPDEPVEIAADVPPRSTPAAEPNDAIDRARARMKKDPVFTDTEPIWDPATKRWVG